MLRIAGKICKWEEAREIALDLPVGKKVIKLVPWKRPEMKKERYDGTLKNYLSSNV